MLTSVRNRETNVWHRDIIWLPIHWFVTQVSEPISTQNNIRQVSETIATQNNIMQRFARDAILYKISYDKYVQRSSTSRVLGIKVLNLSGHINAMSSLAMVALRDAGINTKVCLLSTALQTFPHASFHSTLRRRFRAFVFHSTLTRRILTGIAIKRYVSIACAWELFRALQLLTAGALLAAIPLEG